MEESGEHVAKQLMTAWLRANITGCLFATRFAKEATGRIRPVVLTGALGATHLTQQLDPVLRDAASHSEALLLIFPDLRTPVDVARLIDLFSADTAWTCDELKWKDHPRDDDILISVEWMTPTGHKTSAMGLAPLGSMPLTRRAPYVSIVLWPGGQENPYRQDTRKRVSLADMPHSLSREVHDNYWRQTEENKARYLDGQNEGAARPRVTFCLPAEVRFLISSLRQSPGSA
jgi:hypothetical protein